MAGTTEDARLIVELAKWGAMMDLGPATGEIFSDEFEPETASAHDRSVRTFLVFYETIGTLVKNDLLNRDLVLDWLWAAGVWERIGPAALKLREQTNPRMFENFEALAKSQAD
jgi:hypothetical protein